MGTKIKAALERALKSHFSWCTQTVPHIHKKGKHDVLPQRQTTGIGQNPLFSANHCRAGA